MPSEAERYKTTASNRKGQQEESPHLLGGQNQAWITTKSY